MLSTRHTSIRAVPGENKWASNIAESGQKKSGRMQASVINVTLTRPAKAFNPYASALADIFGVEEPASLLHRSE